MKITRSLYNVLQYLSTIEDVFAYGGKGYFIAKDKVGSGFVEVKAPDYFFKEPFVIRSLSKFLRLFSYDKKAKESDPESVQDWVLEHNVNTMGVPITEICIKSPGRNVRVTQGSPQYLDKRVDQVDSKVDAVVLEEVIKFSMTSSLYKQIITDCSLLDLDRILIVSENSETIKIYLTNSDKKDLSGDLSSYTIECTHTHNTNKMTFLLSAFSLIDATDHQFEYGKYKTSSGNYVNIMKVKSFCDNNLVVQKVIISDKGM